MLAGIGNHGMGVQEGSQVPGFDLLRCGAVASTFYWDFLFLSFLAVLQPGGGGHDRVGSRKEYENSVTLLIPAVGT